MTVRGFGGRAVQALDPFSWNEGAELDQESGYESGSWPTKSELEPGFDTIAPAPRAASDFWGSDDFEHSLGCGRIDSKDTIPSPPPELESSPFHGEF